ncbi:unnamed protein product [Oreochromis niloticus]|nr:unnamed protein product [Mustela putorius furo]
MFNTSNSTAMADYTEDYLYLFNTSNGSYNGSYDDYPDNGDWCEADDHQARVIKTFQACAFTAIFLLGVAGNSLVIATFALYRRFRLRSMTDVFLFHLALADLLLLLTLPLQAIDTQGWLFSYHLCKIMRATYAINTYSGLLLLACISVDRYMVVARAQEMLRLRSQILTAGKLTAVGVWLVAVALSIPEIRFSGVSVSFSGRSGNETEAFCVMQVSGRIRLVPSGVIITVFCLSLAIMVASYTSIARVLWEGHAHRRGKQWQRQRTLKLMVALVLVFLVFQLPYTAVLCRKMFGPFCGLMLEYVTCTLAYTRCCLNPILYALVGVRFRQDVVRLIYDSGCPYRNLVVPQTVNSTSISASSPALTVLSACSPTSPDAPVAFKFSGTK